MEKFPIPPQERENEKPNQKRYAELLSNYSELKTKTSKLQALLLDKMRSDASFWEDPHKSAEGPIRDSNLELSPQEIAKLFNVLEMCTGLHQEVENTYNSFPDDAALYEYVFGRRPEGKIEVIKGPLSLYFRCFNSVDYARIYHQSFFHQSGSDELTQEQIAEAERSGGCAIATATHQALRGAIIAERVQKDISDEDWQSIQKHEEEHVIRRLIKKGWWPERKRSENFVQDFRENVSKEIWSFHEEAIGSNKFKGTKYLDGIPMELARKHVEFLSLQMSDHHFARGADEILAYFKDGMHTAYETYHLLTLSKNEGGLYDYFQEEIEDIKNIASELDKKEMVDDVFRKARGKYYATLEKAIQAVLDLYGTGVYSRDEVIAFFDKEPLVKWPKVTKRMLETIRA